jgi:thiamine monophosphate synthase
VEIPVLGIGGVTEAGAREIAAGTDAAGIAVIGAVMKARDPGEATRRLLKACDGRSGKSLGTG